MNGENKNMFNIRLNTLQAIIYLASQLVSVIGECVVA